MRETSVAIKAAETAGKLAMRHYGKRLKIEKKPDGTPVTIADKLCEKKIIAMIRKGFPSHTIISEESGVAEGNECKWLVDPIDGTKDFIRRLPFFGALVALEKSGELQSGAACMPWFGRTYFAEKGKGAFVNGKRIRVSGVRHMEDAVVFYSSLKNFGEEKVQNVISMSRSAYMSLGISPLYGFVMVAEGVADAVVSSRGYPWDFAAIKIIVEEAGGRMTDFNGRSTIYGGNAIASNGLLHEKIIEMLNKQL